MKILNRYLVILIVLVYTVRIGISFYNFNYKYKDSNYKNIVVDILNIDKIEDKKVTYTCKYNNDTFLIIFYDNVKYNYLDRLKVNAKVIIPKDNKNLYDFKYKRYLNSKDIYGIIVTKEYNKISSKSNLFSYILKYRENISNKIDLFFENNKSNLLKSMLYGDDSKLSDDIHDSFLKTGLSHILVVSGSNINTILFILIFILNKFKIKNLIKNIILIIFIVFFCIMSGSDMSILRASIMSILYIVFSFFNFDKNKYLTCFLAFLFITFYNPYSIFNPSFILSFSAVLSIILFYNDIFSYFNVILVKLFKLNFIIDFNKNNSIYNLNFKKVIYLILKYIFFVLSICISVQILVIPIQIMLFNNINVISIFSNLIIFSLSSLQIILGFLFILLIDVPILNYILSLFNYCTLSLILIIVKYLSNIQLSSISIATQDIFCIICYYLIVLTIFKSDKVYYITKYILKINRNITKLIITICLMYIVLFNVYINYFATYVYFFNVGQGNMTLIKKGKTVIVVDIGSVSDSFVQNSLKNFLKGININKIDLVVITHVHTDHVNGLFKLDIPIKNIMYRNNLNDKNLSEYSINDIKKFAKQNNIKEIIVGQNDKLKLNNINIEILSVDKIIKDKDILNANSLVFTVKLNYNKYLFMGDATKNTEKVIFNDRRIGYVKAIQVGHHGSKTSTSDILLKNSNIKNAVISAKKSVYKHPSKETIDILKKYRIKIYITEKNGGVKK